VLAQVRAMIGKRRLTVVFDRGGYSPKLFLRLIDAGFDLLPYRKGRCRPVPRARFQNPSENEGLVWLRRSALTRLFHTAAQGRNSPETSKPKACTNPFEKKATKGTKGTETKDSSFPSFASVHKIGVFKSSQTGTIRIDISIIAECHTLPTCPCSACSSLRS